MEKRFTKESLETVLLLCLYKPERPRLTLEDRMLDTRQATGEKTSWGKDFPPVRWLPKSPVRERGTPCRGGAPTSCEGERISLVAKELRRGAMRERQVESNPPWRVRGRGQGSRAKPRDLWEEGAEIQDFWGQLCFVPKSKPGLRETRVRAEKRRGLVWI